MFTIRRTLIGLFLLLGVGLCTLVTLQASTTFLQYREAREQTVSNSARELLARAGMALADERTEAYLSLLGASVVEKGAAELSQTTDAVFAEAAQSLALVRGSEGDAVLARLRQALTDLRAVTDARRSTANPEERTAAAPEVLAGYSQLVKDLVSLRVALLTQESPADPGTANAFQMRRYATILLEALSLNEARIGELLTDVTPEARRAAWDQIRGNSERAELAYELLGNRAGASDRAVGLKLAALAVAYEDRYHPLERQLLADLASPAHEADQIRNEAYPLLWSTRQITRTGAEFQESLFTYSRERLAQQQRRASMLALLWASLFLAGLYAVVHGSWVVLRRVITPLDGLRRSMLALAEGDLHAPLPDRGTQDEIGAMADALRVFKANAIRRARLQEERLGLHGKLQAAHRQLQQDLEAASAVQLSLLPEPARLGGVAFTGRLQPSHFISGDTYDVLRQPNGPVHFFLADVAGHGAAAALVSVASRYAAAQTILQRRAGDSLAEAIATLNDDWPEHLPYFTVIMGELRPEEGRGCLVQAGHPPPLLLRHSGVVEMIGDGGLPIGVMRGATFDVVAFGFGPGDRLLVYSDGLSEAENPSGQPFTEERLLDLVRRNLRLPTADLLSEVARTVQDWRGSASAEDDMTLLVLEGVEEALRAAAE
ncbi:response regulator [Rubellimicrobium mesophilum DSM 19309]|uniref:Response regulator n=1 Tax=Rubellimicrobium mesophilum DSM 19309 TaxID=442562 RepID=A0A017HPF0_9RHOB|nr:response regulator [Rubellimicrobium mesophilum DSM 19309]